MQALEELAVSYDVKDREIERSISDKHILEEEVNKLQVGVVRGMVRISPLTFFKYVYLGKCIVCNGICFYMLMLVTSSVSTVNHPG